MKVPVGWFSKKLVWLYFKIVREKADPQYIARGWAIGMFYGCLIPFGLQLACSIPTSFLLKGSKIGATFGTLLTNPVTIFFIYPAQCWVGSRLLGGNISYESISQSVSTVLHHSGPWYESYAVLASQGLHFVLAFFTGGALLTAITTPITYFAVLGMVTQYRDLKARRQAKKEAAKKN